jgi:predicted transcriptional regulator
MSKVITVRLTDELAARLADRKKRTLVPTEAFMRRAVEDALQKEEGAKP